MGSDRPSDWPRSRVIEGDAAPSPELPESLESDNTAIGLVEIDKTVHRERVCDLAPTIVLLRYGEILVRRSISCEEDVHELVAQYLHQDCFMYRPPSRTGPDNNETWPPFATAAFNLVRDGVNTIFHGIGYFVPSKFPQGRIGTITECVCLTFDILFSLDYAATANNSRFNPANSGRLGIPPED